MNRHQALAVLALLLIAAQARCASDSRQHLPLEAAGGFVRAGSTWASLSRSFRFETPGVYYVWLMVAGTGPAGATLAFDLDGTQPLKGRRGCLVLKSSLPAGGWVSPSTGGGALAFVHVARPGRGILRLTARSGEARIRKIALTLFYSARPAGSSLDHRMDPGRGEALIPGRPGPWTGCRSDLAAEPITGRQLFHVDPAGNDSASGLSPQAAWRTFGPVNARVFRPGQAIVLKRGGHWNQGLAPRGDGTPGRPIVLGAYGTGAPPEIDAGSSDAIHLVDQSHWVVRDLKVTSTFVARRSGVQVLATGVGPPPRGIRIRNVVAFDNGKDGIHVGSDRRGNGYRDVSVENCLSFANGNDGIAVNGMDQDGCRQTRIADCTAYSNDGMAGIWIHSGKDGVIERCRAYNNACVNIWTWNSSDITIRSCEAFRGRTPRDAAGFDIDWGCQRCTIEGCYAHHNEGDGYLLMGSGLETYRGFPMRSSYNVLRNSLTESDACGIDICETFWFGKVYGNTAVVEGEARTALKMGGWPLKPFWADAGGWPAGTEVRRNVLVARDGAVPLWVDDWAIRQGNSFDHDLFVRAGRKTPLVRWGGRENGPGFWDGIPGGSFLPRDFYDLQDFRQETGQELHGKETSGAPAAPIHLWSPPKGRSW